jgi:alpha-1,2-mannosyltransferase
MTAVRDVRGRPASAAATLDWNSPLLVYGVITACTVGAVLLRLLQLSRPGYLLGVTEYDDGVLFGNSVRLVNGVIPYRDFAVVQPPGSILLMAPVALVTKVTGTDWGLGIARILTACADCACVPLLGLLVRHRGALAAGVACGVYAVYPDALVASHTLLLEPWLNMFCLIGALLVFDGDRVSGGRRLAWGGAAFGFAVAVKVWALVPLVVIGCLVLRRGPRRLLPLAGGAVAGLGIPVLPFLILAPRALITDTVTSQLVRGAASVGGRMALLPRVGDMLGLSVFPGLSTRFVVLVLLAVAAAVSVGYMAACAAADRLPADLDWYAVVSAAAVIVIFLWPYSYYSHYGAFAGPFIALALALPVGLMCQAEGGAPVVKTLAVGAVAAVIIAGIGLRQLADEVHLQPWNSPAAKADRLIPPGACVLTNDAALTITANRFVSDTPGCPSMVDSFGTLIAMTDGYNWWASNQVQDSVTALWRSEFAQATYVWLKTPSKGQIRWTRGLHDYFVSHFRLIGLASYLPGTSKVPRGGLYIRT